ncbi:uncharacterized protein DUF4012 [Nocardioides sp. J9]|uniref:DUF4012 domain-containing protein n=1 Tax=Nocardioides sp. J9 TaxID=935844 RepID=UPI0011A8FB99|nr:DUF4012 domain-containing protein [Nocardioides sp. J9]TWG93969.1 uncharacterized protein DUF4012 [Nocardioides sp. J9]
MSSRNRWVLAAVGVVVVLAGAWCAYTAWQVQDDLDDAVRHAEAVQTAVEERDPETLRDELDALRDASSAAADRTSGPTWALLTKVPWFGDDAAGIELVSDVLDDLAADGIEPLATVSERVDELLPRDGGADLAVVGELSGPVSQAEAAFARADERLQDVDASGLHTRFTDFRGRVDSAARGLRSARIATDVLPTMLGGDGKRRHLLVFQNNAEVRATGGLPGAVSYLEAEDGRIALTHHVAGSALGRTPTSVLPLTDAEVELYDDYLGRYFVDANMTPDVPRAADLMVARWQQEYPMRPVDGVVMVDAVAISYLLEATGPITVDGVELTGDNLVDELLHESYVRLPEPAAQDAFFAEVAGETFARFTRGVGDPAAMLRALARGVDERRVFVTSYDDDVRAALDGTAIAGELVTDADVTSPQVEVTLNDTTGAKMSYYLRYDVDVVPVSCVDGVQSFSAKARLRSIAPADAATLPAYITGGGDYGVDPGSQVVTVRVFGPVGGTVGQLEFNGEPMDLIRADQDGRPVGMTYVQLDPGQTVDLAWTMKSGAGQTGDAVVAVTPTIEKRNSREVLATACRRAD